MEYGLYPLHFPNPEKEIEKMNYIYFVNRLTGTMILVKTDNEEEIKKYSTDADYYQHFCLEK